MVSSANGLEYNSSRENLTISEYGRHVQKLIKHAKTIEKKEERQAFVESVINLMHQMNPQNKNVVEYRLRLWRHLFRIADYDIDVTPPEEVSTSRPVEEIEKVRMKYPQSEFRFRHYGNTIQLMIEKAIKMEDEDMKQTFTEVIASYMKLAYRTWNKEHYVNDEIIKGDLVKLSKGKLKLEEDFNIGNVAPPSKRPPARPAQRHSKGRKNTNSRNNNNNNNRNRKRK
jgi:hypothetical protein